jgi:hypothetical protein
VARDDFLRSLWPRAQSQSNSSPLTIKKRQSLDSHAGWNRGRENCRRTAQPDRRPVAESDGGSSRFWPSPSISFGGRRHERAIARFPKSGLSLGDKVIVEMALRDHPRHDAALRRNLHRCQPRKAASRVGWTEEGRRHRGAQHPGPVAVVETGGKAVSREADIDRKSITPSLP